MRGVCLALGVCPQPRLGPPVRESSTKGRPLAGILSRQQEMYSFSSVFSSLSFLPRQRGLRNPLQQHPQLQSRWLGRHAALALPKSYAREFATIPARAVSLGALLCSAVICVSDQDDGGLSKEHGRMDRREWTYKIFGIENSFNTDRLAT